MFGLTGEHQKDEERNAKEFWIPERRLLAAVLHRAVSDYTGPDTKLAEEAREWIFDDVTEPHHVFSFAWVCEQLDLNESIIASAISCLPRQSTFAHETTQPEPRRAWGGVS